MEATWVKNFKIALIEEDFETMSELLDKIPEFDELNNMKQASALIKQAKIIAEAKKLQTATQMVAIKKSKGYLFN
ncbi:MAG: hypothetical protein HXX81_02020 [Campylobacterales bacterium]|nr:hypothetical protein [Campylobacterales bacterium]